MVLLGGAFDRLAEDFCDRGFEAGADRIRVGSGRRRQDAMPPFEQFREAGFWAGIFGPGDRPFVAMVKPNPTPGGL